MSVRGSHLLYTRMRNDLKQLLYSLALGLILHSLFSTRLQFLLQRKSDPSDPSVVLHSALKSEQPSVKAEDCEDAEPWRVRLLIQRKDTIRVDARSFEKLRLSYI